MYCTVFHVKMLRQLVDLFSESMPHQTSTPQKTKPCSLVIHQWHGVIWLVGNSKYLQYENWTTDFRNSSKILHFFESIVLFPTTLSQMTHDQILFWSHVSRHDPLDRGLGALLVEKFLKAHGALYEQKAHLLLFWVVEGWNIWWIFFFLMKNTCSFKEKTTTRKCLRLMGDVQEAKMILIDSFKMSLKDGNDGIHYIWSVTKIFRFNEFS